MSIEIHQFQDFKKLVELTQEEDKWSTHAFIASIDAINGPLFNVTPLDITLPQMAGLKVLGGLDFTDAIVGQNVVCAFDASGSAVVLGPVLDTIDSDYVPLGSALVTFLNLFVNTFLTHLHIATSSTGPTGTPVDATQTPITSAQLSVPSNLLSSTTKVKV